MIYLGEGIEYDVENDVIVDVRPIYSSQSPAPRSPTTTPPPRSPTTSATNDMFMGTTDCDQVGNSHKDTEGSYEKSDDEDSMLALPEGNSS